MDLSRCLSRKRWVWSRNTPGFGTTSVQHRACMVHKYTHPHTPKLLFRIKQWQWQYLEICAIFSCVYQHQSITQTCPHSVLSTQACSTDLDGGAAVGDMSTLLRPGGHAHLCRQHGRSLQLVQEGVGHGAGQLLLGLLLHSGPRWLHQWQVSIPDTIENTQVSVMLNVLFRDALAMMSACFTNSHKTGPRTGLKKTQLLQSSYLQKNVLDQCAHWRILGRTFTLNLPA